MSNPAEVSAFDTGRPVRLHFRMKIVNPEQFWYHDHDSNAYMEHQMDMFKDTCEKLLTEHMPKGTFVSQDTETCWRYITQTCKVKSNYGALLQCAYVAAEDVIEHVHALAPDDTILMVIDNHQHEVEVLWPDWQKQYAIDICDEKGSTYIDTIDKRVAKAALEAAGLQPIKLKHATDIWGTTTVMLSTWIVTFEVDTVKTLEPIRFMFGEYDLSIEFSQQTD